MNIFIFGANWYNRGDESALRAMIDELYCRYPECNVRIHFNQDVYDFPYSDVRLVKKIEKPRLRHPIRRICFYITVFYGKRIKKIDKKLDQAIEDITDAAKWCDIAVYAPGGPSFGDIYRQYFLVYIINLISKMNKRIMLYAPSVGPFTKHRDFIKKAIERTTLICVREKQSQVYLGELCPQKETIVTLDAAFQHSADRSYQESLLEKDNELCEYLKSHNKVVGITIIDFKKDKCFSDLGQIVRNSFESLLEYLSKNNYGVIFVPQLFGKDNDYDYMNTYKIHNEYVLPDNYDCYFQQYVISRCYATVGMRYHSNIFSAKMCTPFISVSYQHKMSSFMSMNGLENCSIEVKELTPDLLIEKFQILEQNYCNYKKLLNDKKDYFCCESYKTSRMLYALIDS